MRRTSSPRSATAFLSKSTHPRHINKKGRRKMARPGQFQILIWRRTPITRPAPRIKSLEALPLLGLGRSRFGAERGRIIPALHRFRVAQLAGHISGLGFGFAAEKKSRAP